MLNTEVDAGRIACANINTHYLSHSGRPNLCLLIQPQEHPRLRHESCMAFEFAEMLAANTLSDRKRDGDLKQDRPCSTELLQRVQEGALASSLVPNEVKDAIRATLELDTS